MNGLSESYSVSDITEVIKSLLEEEPFLQNVWVQGEVSNFTRASSGHLYFTLKDDRASIQCVQFKSFFGGETTGSIKTGDHVMVLGQITVYAPRGNYQLVVSKIESQGKGDLFEAFTKLKEKLLAEGLFEEKHKKPLPFIPQCIGIISSPTGAVIQDILRTLENRFPHVRVVLATSLMQGVQSAQSIVESIDKLEKEIKPDLIIIARGGGSMEDLWSLNDEQLVRRIFNCKIPVVSAIGHETDFTLCDFVADQRASTPTGAAQLVTPDITEIKAYLAEGELQLKKSITQLFTNYWQLVDDYDAQLHRGIRLKTAQLSHNIKLLSAQLEKHNPELFFQKGYTLTLKNGKPVKSKMELNTGDNIETIFKDGITKSTVN